MCQPSAPTTSHRPLEAFTCMGWTAEPADNSLGGFIYSLGVWRIWQASPTCATVAKLIDNTYSQHLYFDNRWELAKHVSRNWKHYEAGK